jgi:hypothetical protein
MVDGVSVESEHYGIGFPAQGIATGPDDHRVGEDRQQTLGSG